MSDLIRREDAIEAIYDGGTVGEARMRTETRAECAKAVIAVPAVDAVEMRHGQWIDKQALHYRRMQSWCSACGKHSGIGGIESNRHKPYCPNCGAKMDGGKDDAID